MILKIGGFEVQYVDQWERIAARYDTIIRKDQDRSRIVNIQSTDANPPRIMGTAFAGPYEPVVDMKACN
jgi:hypothetical protein